MPDTAVIFKIFTIAPSYRDFNVRISHIDEGDCNEQSAEHICIYIYI